MHMWVVWLLLLVAIPLGGAEAGQIGVKASRMIGVHGHGSITDGGTLNAPTFSASGNFTSLSSGVTKTLSLDAVQFDVDNAVNLSTDKHLPTQAGKYIYTASILGNCSTSYSNVSGTLFKNGSPAASYFPASLFGSWSTSMNSINFTMILDMNGTTDYVQVAGQITGVGSCNLLVNRFQGIRISN